MSLLNNYTLANTTTSYYALAGSGTPIPGPPGPAGPQGVKGDPGISILSGVLPPTAAVGDISDLYVDLATSQLYKKTDAVTWTPEFSMIGATGPDGTAATVTIGVTSTLPPGSSANVNNTGTPLNAILNFAIPQGETGSTGDVSSWSDYPATQTVDYADNSLTNVAGISAPLGLNVDILTGNLNMAVKGMAGTFKFSGGDMDLSGQSVTNTSGMSGDNLSLVSTTGNINLTPLNPTDPKVSILGGDLDMNGGDILNAGSISTSGVANSVTLGGYVPPAAPLALFQAIASDVVLSHINPLTELSIKAVEDARIEATDGDLNLIGNDVNVASTGLTSALNITAAGVLQNTATLAINNTAGAGFAVQAGGLISLLTLGSIEIGSGNVLGTTTNIEHVDFKDNVISKSESADLEILNVSKLNNDTNAMEVSADNGFLTIKGHGLQILGTGISPFTIGNLTDPSGISFDPYSGEVSFSAPPLCSVAPTTADQLVNKTYADTKLSGDSDIELTHNLIAPAIDSTTNGPFLYVPSAATAPTGTPPEVPGAVPLFVQTGASAKLWTYFAGTWVPI